MSDQRSRFTGAGGWEKMLLAYRGDRPLDADRYRYSAIRANLSIPPVYLSSALNDHKITTVSLGRPNTQRGRESCYVTHTFRSPSSLYPWKARIQIQSYGKIVTFFH